MSGKHLPVSRRKKFKAKNISRPRTLKVKKNCLGNVWAEKYLCKKRAALLYVISSTHANLPSLYTVAMNKSLQGEKIGKRRSDVD